MHIFQGISSKASYIWEFLIIASQDWENPQNQKKLKVPWNIKSEEKTIKSEEKRKFSWNFQDLLLSVILTEFKSLKHIWGYEFRTPINLTGLNLMTIAKNMCFFNWLSHSQLLLIIEATASLNLTFSNQHLLKFWPKCHQVPLNKIRSLILTQCLAGFELVTFQFLLECLYPLGYISQTRRKFEIHCIFY